MGAIHRIAVAIFLCYARLSSGAVTPGPTQFVTQQQADVNLICSATGDVESCSWNAPDGTPYTIPRKGLTADGGRLRYYEGTASECGIVISSIKDSDKGDWTCSVSIVQDGEVMTETAVAQLDFAIPPSSLILTMDAYDGSKANVSAGEEVSVSCVADKAKAEPTFSWYVDVVGSAVNPDAGDDFVQAVDTTTEEYESAGKTENQEIIEGKQGLSTYTQKLTYTPAKEHQKLWCKVRHPSLLEPLEVGVELVFVEHEPEPTRLGPGATVSIIIAVLIALSIITILFIFYRTKMTGRKDDDEEGADGEKIPLESGKTEEESEEKSEEKAVVQEVNEVKEEPKKEVEEEAKDKGEENEKVVEEEKKEEAETKTDEASEDKK
jgi:hypothetical protein